MTVTEALKIVQRASPHQPPFRVFLACGFTPLHLQTFLRARLQESQNGRFVEVQTGLYGNLAASLEALETSETQAVACALEWSDLDPRFSYREAGLWTPAAITDIVTTAAQMLDRLHAALSRIPAGVRVAVSLPTLPLPPLFHTAGWQSSEAELLIERSLADFAARVIERRGTVLVNARRLNEDSAPRERLDLKSDLATGLPYTLPHADALACAFTHLLAPPAPKKGIITDLDDTLWLGLVGELGPEGVAWDLASHAQIHALYQKLLSSLAEAGILIAIASKNDSAVVAKALDRSDLLLRPHQVFPIEVHWEPKSGSVDRILSAWNIGADSVIFVDDSPMELAEVSAAHPGVQGLQFPTNQPQHALSFLRKLRDLCGKERLSGEDALRLESLRRSSESRGGGAAAATPEGFLESANAALTIDFGVTIEDSRALELVNKTNQFNINGARYSEAEWRQKLSRSHALALTVSYEDRFGPLGKIGVIQGYWEPGLLTIETWVMSCRAFARRIEFQCLKVLFERYRVTEVAIQFAPTAKNSPAQDFFAVFLGRKPDCAFHLTRAQLDEKCPPLYHHISETERVHVHG